MPLSLEPRKRPNHENPMKLGYFTNCRSEPEKGDEPQLTAAADEILESVQLAHTSLTATGRQRSIIDFTDGFNERDEAAELYSCPRPKSGWIPGRKSRDTSRGRCAPYVTGNRLRVSPCTGIRTRNVVGLRVQVRVGRLVEPGAGPKSHPLVAARFSNLAGGFGHKLMHAIRRQLAVCQLLREAEVGVPKTSCVFRTVKRSQMAKGGWRLCRKHLISAHRQGRVGEQATRIARPALPSSNRRCRFPTSGSPEGSRLRHAHFPIDGSAPTSPNAAAIVRLADDGMAAGCVAANAGLENLDPLRRLSNP